MYAKQYISLIYISISIHFVFIINNCIRLYKKSRYIFIYIININIRINILFIIYLNKFNIIYSENYIIEPAQYTEL